MVFELDGSAGFDLATSGGGQRGFCGLPLAQRLTTRFQYLLVCKALSRPFNTLHKASNGSALWLGQTGLRTSPGQASMFSPRLPCSSPSVKVVFHDVPEHSPAQTAIGLPFNPDFLPDLDMLEISALRFLDRCLLAFILLPSAMSHHFLEWFLDSS